MPSTPRRLAAFVSLVLAGFCLLVITSPSGEVRVESKEDAVRVLPRTGLWFHEYRVTVQRATGPHFPNQGVAVSGSAAPADGDDENDASIAEGTSTEPVERYTFRVTEEQYDALRTGERLKASRLRFMSSVAWKSEETSMHGFVRALGARIAQYQSPRFLSPVLGNTPGLARVLSVHRIAPKGGALGRDAAHASNAALDLIVVEFWAPRHRTLVRTADVVNARSIDDLGPGQVLQMHFDPRYPRRMRLDDGMRSTQP